MRTADKEKRGPPPPPGPPRVLGPQWQEMVEPATAVITLWNPNWRTMAHTDSGMAGSQRVCTTKIRSWFTSFPVSWSST